MFWVKTMINKDKRNFGILKTLQANDSGSGLAIGLSLGVLVGLLIDDLGLGMMLGVAVGLCTGPAIGALRKNKKAENQKDNEKQ